MSDGRAEAAEVAGKTADQTGDALLLRRKRALYRAQHRGTKEMDWMIGRFADAHLGSMGEERLAQFETFLQVGDPELNAWILDPRQCTEAAFAELLAEIRAFNSLA